MPGAESRRSQPHLQSKPAAPTRRSLSSAPNHILIFTNHADGRLQGLSEPSRGGGDEVEALDDCWSRSYKSGYANAKCIYKDDTREEIFGGQKLNWTNVNNVKYL